MKKTITLITLLLCQLSYAAVKNEGYLINTNLKYTTASKKEISASKEFILPADNKGWVTLTDFKNNVVLLGRALKADKETIHLEYMLIDGNQKPNVVVSTPSIVAIFNEPTSIRVGEQGEKPTLSLSVVAKKTEYTTEGQTK